MNKDVITVVLITLFIGTLIEKKQDLLFQPHHEIQLQHSGFKWNFELVCFLCGRRNNLTLNISSNN